MSHHAANGGSPGADRPSPRLSGCPRVSASAPPAQDVLPGICQGSHSPFLQGAVSVGGGSEGEPHRRCQASSLVEVGTGASRPG
jgi:hypothetical protein